MLSTHPKHASTAAGRAWVAAHRSIDAVFAHRRGWLLLGVLAGALTLSAPGAASGQSISAERAFLNTSSAGALSATVDRRSSGSVAVEPSWPSGRQALLGSSGSNSGLTYAVKITESPGMKSYPDGDQALLGRRRPSAVGAESLNGSKP